MAFHEVQRVGESWLWAVLGLVAAVFLALCVLFAFLARRNAGAGVRTIFILAGVACLVTGALPIAFGASLSMTTDEEAEGLHVHIAPFLHDELVPWDRIVSAKARTYAPLREYGGWGIRRGRSGRALNMTGREGVQLQLVRPRERLLVGSGHAKRLARIVSDRARGTEPGGRAVALTPEAPDRCPPARLERLHDVQCTLAARRATPALEWIDALEARAARAEVTLEICERSWLRMYRGFALDLLGRRADAARAYGEAEAIRHHGDAAKGVEQPRPFPHLLRIARGCPSEVVEAHWQSQDRPVLHRVQCLVAERRGREALAEADRARRGELLDSDRMWLLVYRGVAFDQLGRRSDAATEFERALQFHASAIAEAGRDHAMPRLDSFDRIRRSCD